MIYRYIKFSTKKVDGYRLKAQKIINKCPTAIIIEKQYT